MPSVYIKTYGCQMNERDSEAVAAQLVAKGYSLAPSELTADVILLNTCSVRDMAERKAVGKMANLAADVRKHRPEVVLGFMGCMAQSRGQALIDKLPDVDLVLGTQKFHRAAEYLDEILAGTRAKIVDVAEEKGSEAEIRQHLLEGNNPGKKSVTAFVSIMQGCNQYCTFCIVPYTRGEERSRTIPDIVAECRELVGRGVREITLLGQIVTSYGKRQPPGSGRLHVAHLGIEIAFADLGAELHFLDRDLNGLLARFLGLLAFLVPKLSVVHDPAHRWVRHRCHLDEIEVLLAGESERIWQILDSKLAAVCADETNLTGADAVVVPVLRLLRRCYG